QVFRIIGPDGKVTFSDRPPPDAKAVPAQTVTMGGGGGTPSASLPLELRNVVNRYPVTLYTTANCGPCESARSYLRQRGVPYTEYTVSKNEDYATQPQRAQTAPNPDQPNPQNPAGIRF